MKAEYEVTLKVKVTHDIDTLEGLKSNLEFANDLCQMIVDESTQINAVATYEIIKSEVKVTPRYCKLVAGCPHNKNICCRDCDVSNCTMPMYIDCLPETCNCLTYEKPN